jgi:hypothetical protein
VRVLDGDVLSVADGVMPFLWLAAGLIYYQILRFRHTVVAALSWLRRVGTPHFIDDLRTE